MLARDFRKKAMDALKGKWGRFALIYLIYTLITTVCSYALSAASLIIAGPFAVGIAMIALKV